MSEHIKDGTGKGFLAKVGPTNRLAVDGVIDSFLRDVSVESEQSYYLASDFVDLTTTGTALGMFYCKYTGTKKMSVFNIRTCGTGIQQWVLLKNPTTGTLISDTNAGHNNNLHFVSSNILSADVYAASADGKTVTNGTHLAQWINGTGHSTSELDGAIILSQNESFALTCQIITALTACATVLCYEF